MKRIKGCVRLQVCTPKYMLDNMDYDALIKALRKYVMDAYQYLLDIQQGRAKKPDAALRVAAAHLFLARTAIEVLVNYKELEAQKILRDLDVPESVIKIVEGEQ